ncbi:dTDP-4-keto-6-deoxy-D-glucose epimerase [Azospirillum sp. RWY-5-1]|uniref:dTDP-4-dehydrorhamnose 3,5-epimerase n=1 Tax=Azospirillum oleiclasticum TaxID=2735135 RepID=A0ABX2TKJ9_9PROT|nr:dTDP-4-dehydrorhamnose 3,5-epimerase [Azospirillum oleiclasticum]NYZ17507.1 dTDP-4-keto-6-deoxy-D-glucose epimerase [Azospirillum oleiclasticum]NYZ24885.1 dTDP-4-keto-6-deoxy-D-glucose epimerase [Azospirillum oleiclasticum]
MTALKVRETTLDGVLVIEAPTNFEDFRGSYVELYNRDIYHAAGLTQDFLQDDISTSGRHVLRGVHGDGKTWKLVSCLYGSFYLAVVNWDPGSPGYRRWEGFTLSDSNRLSVLIPPRHGNGHVVMSERAIFHYKQTTQYDRSSQFTLRYDDPAIGIWWPVKTPILSRRDDEVPHV